MSGRSGKRKSSTRRSSDSSSDPSKSPRSKRRKVEPGQRARNDEFEVQSFEVGALPLFNRLLDRMRLQEILTEQLPEDDSRAELSTAKVLLVLVRNVLVSREPVYGIAEWAARFAPDLFSLWPHEIGLLHDDRIGRSLDRLFRSVGPQLLLAVVRQVVQEFQVSLDELHNDSTTVSFYGAYEEAAQEGKRHGHPTHAITWGHSKARRPDLKQLLYTLTISEDGGVPVYFTSASGNVADDVTHCETWDVLRQLVGRSDFLYVADCKLASSENLAHIASREGRFVTVMPRTYKEDDLFRARLRDSASSVTWRKVYDIMDERGELKDCFSVCTDEMISSDGYRLLWFHSTRKVHLDGTARNGRIQRATARLAELKAKLLGPRTRYHERAKVEDAVARLLNEHDVTGWVQVRIEERLQESYQQEGRGRRSPKTRFIKTTRLRYTISWELDRAAISQTEREDGTFPLLTNDRSFDGEQVLRAYKRQPLIEKRFSQFKTDFAVAPVYLKSVTRIQGLLAVYFLVLLVQTLLEREVRRAMAKAEVLSLPLYPEGRPCTRPTTHRIVELFETVQRHLVMHIVDGEATSDDCDLKAPQSMVTALTPLQCKIIRLLGLAPDKYGQ
jgi:transposase